MKNEWGCLLGFVSGIVGLYVRRLELGLIGCLSFSFYNNGERADKPLFLAFELISFDLDLDLFFWLFGGPGVVWFGLPLFHTVLK